MTDSQEFKQVGNVVNNLGLISGDAREKIFMAVESLAFLYSLSDTKTADTISGGNHSDTVDIGK